MVITNLIHDGNCLWRRRKWEKSKGKEREEGRGRVGKKGGEGRKGGGRKKTRREVGQEERGGG